VAITEIPIRESGPAAVSDATTVAGEFETPGRFNIVDKVATGVATVVPVAALAVGVWLAWDNSLYWQDV
jgi:hypothetical protein